MSKKDEAIDKKKRLNALINKINSRAKSKVVCFASETPNPYILRPSDNLPKNNPREQILARHQHRDSEQPDLPG